MELLKRLETEGCEQADVTRPTARITAELQGTGIVPDGVEPALLPIYRGGVRAEAFQIPAEMVAILTAEQGAEPESGV